MRLDFEGPIAWLVLDNPRRLNALSVRMWEAIPGLVAAFEGSPARVAIIAGAGDRAFSAGADISEFEESRSGESAKTYDALNHAAFEALARCAKPLVAMIRGPCMGGGLGLALACDLRIADETAAFAIPAAKLGVGYNPRWIPLLLAAISATHVKELLFTGRRFSAAEALSMGLVNRVVAPADLDSQAEALARDVAANAPLTLRAAKRAIDELARKADTADMAGLERLVDACFDSADYAEGRRAFLDKRKPRFEGR